MLLIIFILRISLVLVEVERISHLQQDTPFTTAKANLQLVEDMKQIPAYVSLTLNASVIIIKQISGLSCLPDMWSPCLGATTGRVSL